MKSVWLLLTVCGLSLCVVAAANGPNGAEIFKKAQASAKKLRAVAYEATLHTEWSSGGKERDQAAHVTMLRNHPELPKIRIDAQSENENGETSTTTQVTSDGKAVCAINHAERQCRQAEGPRAISLLTPYVGLLIGDFVGGTPYAEEMAAKAVTYVGTEKVGETECHVVDVTYPRGQSTARWYFGTEDYLPRRLERTLTLPIGKRTRVLTLSALEPDPTITDDLFHLKVPDEYEVQAAPTKGARPRGSGTLLAAGTEAPDFTLKTPEGRDVRLADLRGKVVLLDFWATWCVPCKQAMPGLQKLHEEMKDKPFALYGVNVWERRDAVRYMKSKALTYGLLLKGDAVAQQYQVRGIPTFYVIGHDGKVVYAASGMGRDAELRAAVEQALSKIP